MRNDLVLFTVSVLALSIASSGCSSNPRPESPTQQTALTGDVAPGTLLIDLIETGRPTHYWQYQVQPSTGSVHKIKEETFPDYQHEVIPHDFQEPAGAIETCQKKPSADSPDGRYSAYCTGLISSPDNRPDELFLIDRKTSQTLYHWKPAEWRSIRGFAWAPNSHSVAFLNKSSYYGTSWIERLIAKSGHPIPHDSIFLDILDVDSAGITEYEIRRNVPYSFTRILSWSSAGEAK